MVLGVQWLESLDPILWDFNWRTLVFVCDGHRVVWHASDAAAPPTTLMSTHDDLMDELLSAFAPLVDEPTGLPPPRQRSHHIQSLPGTAPVAVRPYLYAYTQKTESERRCVYMLRSGVIKSSSSAFSAPVLLVKKHDGSWRFCVDYRALSDRTMKDKFPIPVVEELLDELCDTRFFTKLDLRSGYHKVRMHPDNIEKTTFHTHEGLFEFLIMPFGLTNAPATF
jgi:hypothetical protein